MPLNDGLRTVRIKNDPQVSQALPIPFEVPFTLPGRLSPSLSPRYYPKAPGYVSAVVLSVALRSEIADVWIKIHRNYSEDPIDDGVFDTTFVNAVLPFGDDQITVEFQPDELTFEVGDFISVELMSVGGFDLEAQIQLVF